MVWFILAILYEGVKTLREYLIYLDMKHWKKYNRGHGRSCRGTSIVNSTDKSALIVSENCDGGSANKG